MHRSLVAVLVAATLNASPATAAGRGPCSEDRFDVKPRLGVEVVASKVRSLIRCAVSRFGPVDDGVARALAVADCESGFWPWAHGGDNLGVFQHKDDYWRGRVDRWLRPEWFNRHQWQRVRQVDRHGVAIPTAAMLARANVIVSIRMAASGGWGPWSCA